MVPLLIVAGLGAGAVVAVVATSGDAKKANAGEIFAEPASSKGPAPFTPPVVVHNPAPTSTTSTSSTISSTTTTVAPTSTTSAATSTSARASTTSGPTTSSVPSSSTSSPVSTGPPPTATSVAPSVAIPSTTIVPPAPQGPPGGATVVPTVTGNKPGLYGGTGNNVECDASMLVSYLEATPAKASAWAAAEGIAVDQIRSYVAGLTPVILRADTRVTNYGYKNGVATPRQAVLQAGTAVFVDQYGVPRSRCLCGNPLGEPRPVNGPTAYGGEPWPGLDPSTTEVVMPSPQPVTTIIIIDTSNGNQVTITTGNSPTIIVVEPPAGSPPTTSSQVTVPPLPTQLPSTIAIPSSTAIPTTTVAPTTTAVPTTTEAPMTTTTVPATAPPTSVDTATSTAAGTGSDITADGGIDTSTQYSEQYAAKNAFDGDLTTSWFSAGDKDTTCQPITPGVSCSNLVWQRSATDDTLINEIQIFDNSQNSNPANRHGFGFARVWITITDSTFQQVYQQEVDFPGGDTNADVFPNVRGHRIVFTFEVHQSPDCGGVSEIKVVGAP